MVILPEHLLLIAGRNEMTPLIFDLSKYINQVCPDFEIDTAQEYAHFLAQACHETNGFRTLVEYGSGAAYEGRRNLGNIYPGDGPRFKGRGIFQTTGRANYDQLGLIRGIDGLFTNTPDLLEHPSYAVWSACVFWQTRGLNDIANHGDADRIKKKRSGEIIEVSPVEYIGLTINGGYNGMDERKRLYTKAKQVLA